jgi:hypothetical protein
MRCPNYLVRSGSSDRQPQQCSGPGMGRGFDSRPSHARHEAPTPSGRNHRKDLKTLIPWRRGRYCAAWKICEWKALRFEPGCPKGLGVRVSCLPLDERKLTND